MNDKSPPGVERLEHLVPSDPPAPTSHPPVESESLTPLTCLQCKHEWTPRVPSPVRCPSCQSKLWAIPPKETGLDALGVEGLKRYITPAGTLNCRLVLEIYRPPETDANGERVKGTGLYEAVAGETVLFRISAGGGTGGLGGVGGIGYGLPPGRTAAGLAMQAMRRLKGDLEWIRESLMGGRS